MICLGRETDCYILSEHKNQNLHSNMHHLLLVLAKHNLTASSTFWHQKVYVHWFLYSFLLTACT